MQVKNKLHLKDETPAGLTRNPLDTSLIHNPSGSLKVFTKQEMQAAFIAQTKKKKKKPYIIQPHYKTVLIFPTQIWNGYR